MTRYVMLCRTRKVHHLGLAQPTAMATPLCGEPFDYDRGDRWSTPADRPDLDKRPICTRCLARVRELNTFLPPTTTVSIEGYVGGSIDDLVKQINQQLDAHRRRMESVR